MDHRRSLIRATTAALALLCTSVSFAESAADLWAQRIQPLFDLHCVKCHGPLEQKSGLGLDHLEAILHGGEEGPVVVPGDPHKSRLYQYLAAGSDPHMPPKKQLSDADQAWVARWITALPTAASSPQAKRVATRSFTGPADAIDALIAEGWSSRQQTPAAPADPPSWCRRVYLDLAGRIPTAHEQAEFLAAPEASRRESLVDRLLAAPGYPVHMRELWDVFLMGRPKRDAHEDRRRQNGWWTFLETAFRENRPWNETVRAILVARPGSAEEKGASWFLYERRNEHQAIAEAVAPVIYGTRVDCAQCHDHPLTREIKQAHYWGLVAAFNRSKNVEGGSDVSESAVGGFINFTNLKKESQPALLQLLNGRVVEEERPKADQKETDSDALYVEPAAKARVPKKSRRAAFAEAASRDNPLLARAMVNRVWATFLGRGIVHPTDEMNGRNPPSHPELLDWLSKDFAAHGYDVRRLVRSIVLSRPYGLAMGNTVPEAFASALERPLAGEQLARSWEVALERSPDDDPLRRATIGALPDVLPRDYNATFQQAQFFANSPALSGLLKPVEGGAIRRLSSLANPAERAREVFRCAYGRIPDETESVAATAFLREHGGTSEAGIADLFWSLLTSAEFLSAP